MQERRNVVGKNAPKHHRWLTTAKITPRRRSTLKKQKSAKAANACFALANPTYDIKSFTSLQKCDLHGLTIAEALIKAKEHVRACKALHLDQTILITGKGLHSQNGRARLKPALEQFCKEEKLGATIDPLNEGRIHLQLDTSTQKPWYLRWSNTGDDACTIM